MYEFDYYCKEQIVFFDSTNKQENGIDGGGLSKEHMTLLVRSLFSIDSGLFMESEYGELFPCYVNLTEELQNQYRFVGQVIGRLLLTRQLCEARFASFFLNLVFYYIVVYYQLLRNSSSFNDLKQRSSSLYQSLLYLRDQYYNSYH